MNEDTKPKHRFGHRIPQKCSVEGCDRNLSSHGMCHIHWGRFQRNGTTDKPIRERHDYIDKKGYVRRYVDGKRQGQYVHRLVMEEILGRELLLGETVHHKNDINGDNEPANLELWTALHPKGSRVIDLLEFAHLVIERYEKNISGSIYWKRLLIKREQYYGKSRISNRNLYEALRG